jgi:hypothetical protein
MQTAAQAGQQHSTDKEVVYFTVHTASILQYKTGSTTAQAQQAAV